jgi:hypothetical protein
MNGFSRTTFTIASVVLFWSGAVAHAQAATFAGTVLSDPDERRIADAEVILPQINKSVRSDSLGNFRITGIPAGAQVVIVRHPGYEAARSTVSFAAGQVVEADLLLAPSAATLPTVEVREKEVDARLREFNERRAAGTGRFLTADVFDKNRQRQLSEVLIGSIAGLRAVGNTDEKFIVSARGSGNHPCDVQIVLNGISVYNGNAGQPEFDINRLITPDVLGVEYYTPATTPSRFNATGGGMPDPSKNERGSIFEGTRSPLGAACGTLVIWTK